MKKEDLHGYVPAIATPFNEKGEIMDDAFAELFDFLIGRGATRSEEHTSELQSH